MNIRTKAFISVSIFLILMFGSWWIHRDFENNPRFPHLEGHDRPDVQILHLDREEPIHPSFKYLGVPFRPREYVRIYPRFTDNE